MTFAADSVSATPFRGGSATLNPPLGHSKAREEEKLLYDSSRANNVRPYHMNLKYSMQPKEKIKALSAFSFAIATAKEKAIKKKSADMRFRALRSTTDAAVGSRRLPQKAGENFIGEKILVMTKNTASKNRQLFVADFYRIALYLYYQACQRYHGRHSRDGKQR